jgi:hypothetical protein
MATSIFVQSDADPGKRQELARVFGASAVTRNVPVEIARKGLVHQVRAGLGILLRQLARALYLSPFLIVLKFVLQAWSETASDMVIVVFCGIVVAFFVTLNLYVFWSLAWWTQTRRPRAGIARWRPFSPRLLPAPGRVSVSGRIERLGAEGDGVVLRDFWADAVLPFRLTEVTAFLVRPDDLTAQPVVVACTTAPEIDGHGEPTMASDLLDAVSPEARALAGTGVERTDQGVALALREGDRVEVTAVLAEPLDNLDRVPLPGGEILVGDREGDPYRDNPGASPRTGLLFLDDEKSPLAIRRLG